jgi:hypothetical protein
VKKILKALWKNWDNICDEWFNFLGKTILWSVLYIATDYELIYTKNENPSTIIIKLAFIAITFFSSISLILYIFKKCYYISNILFKPGSSKLLWIITVIEAILFCFVSATIMMMIAFTLKTIPGL